MSNNPTASVKRAMANAEFVVNEAKTLLPEASPDALATLVGSILISAELANVASSITSLEIDRAINNLARNLPS